MGKAEFRGCRRVQGAPGDRPDCLQGRVRIFRGPTRSRQPCTRGNGPNGDDFRNTTRSGSTLRRCTPGGSRRDRSGSSPNELSQARSPAGYWRPHPLKSPPMRGCRVRGRVPARDPVDRRSSRRSETRQPREPACELRTASLAAVRERFLGSISGQSRAPDIRPEARQISG